MTAPIEKGPSALTSAILADLARVRAIFQLRAILAAMGVDPAADTYAHPADGYGDSTVERVMCINSHEQGISL